MSNLTTDVKGARAYLIENNSRIVNDHEADLLIEKMIVPAYLIAQAEDPATADKERKELLRRAYDKIRSTSTLGKVAGFAVASAQREAHDHYVTCQHAIRVDELAIGICMAVTFAQEVL